MHPLALLSVRNQFAGSFVVNIISLSHGFALGWVSPSLEYLQSNGTHLTSGPITVEQTSWLGSSISLGAVFGVVLYGFIADRFGKRTALQLTLVPHVVRHPSLQTLATVTIVPVFKGFWLCIIFARDVMVLCVGRLLSGAAGGGILRIVPLFIADIADCRIRGMLGSLLPVCLNLGTVLAFVLGTFVHFSTFPLVALALPVFFGFTICLIPETPPCLLRALRNERAERSLMFYRGIQGHFAKSDPFRDEFRQLQDVIERERTAPDAGLTWQDFATQPARRGLALAMFLVLLNQCCGSLVLITYATTIFDLASPPTPTHSQPVLPASLASITLATVQLLGTFISLALIDRIGRRILLIVSCLGVSLGYLILAAYVQLVLPLGPPSPLGQLLPIVSLSFSILLASIGLLSVPYIVMAEVLPAKIRNVGSSICITIVAFCAFVLLKIFPILLDTIGLPGTMGGLAMICLIGTPVIAYFLPETQGKSLLPNTTLEGQPTA
ncbi:facilitated trehalose transporter Tret1-like [Anopheles nili]|uniref:facilitated trehalose transporter Tret1-like n=1 Tax=Anopheles nili TaxID=185578 RepID=UPI00237BB921|nr:facilitated trehalose transporter Tret1-like [Anopheles nili]